VEVEVVLNMEEEVEQVVIEVHFQVELKFQ
jgi:hypothetical protein